MVTINNKKITISPTGVSGKDIVVLKVAVDLLQAHDCNVELTQTEQAGADIAVVDADSDTGRLLLEQSPQTRRVLALCSADTCAASNIRVIRKPVRVQELKDALHELCRLDLSRAMTGVRTSSAPATPPPRAQGTRTLFETLVELRKARRTAHLSIEGGAQLWVNPAADQLVTTAPDALPQLGATPRAQLTVADLSEEAFAQQAEQLQTHSLAEQLWRLAQRAPTTDVLGDYDLNTPVRLRAWPNFTRYGVNPQHLQLTALMTRQARTLNDIRQASGLAQEDVVSFCNAAYAVGLLQVSPAEAAQPTRPGGQHRARRGLFAKLAQRLSLATNEN